MSKAREIAEERFAKGEISEEELNNIISSLNKQKQNDEKIEPSEKDNLSGIGYTLVVLGGLGAAFSLYMSFSSSSRMSAFGWMFAICSFGALYVGGKILKTTNT